MPLPATALERAFELANSGQYGTVAEIRARLQSEGLDPIQVQGASVSFQLRTLMRKARGLRQQTMAKAYRRNLKF
jgi:hypothetical protein